MRNQPCVKNDDLFYKYQIPIVCGVALVNCFVLRAYFVKRKPGRSPAVLTKRFVMRCTPREFTRWTKHARALGMNGVAPLVRKATNDVVTLAMKA